MRWRWLTRIDHIDLGRSASGSMVFPDDSPFFEDHFPGFPVVPGVLLLEAMAQLSGKLIGYTVRKDRGDWPFPILSMANNVKFRKFVRPGELACFESTILELREESSVVAVKTRVDGKVVAQAEEVFVFNAVPLASPAEAERLERLERSELARLWPGYPGD